MYKIGFAKDIHRLVKNRKLILGGVLIPFDLGEEAHSDGDVVFHALSEAILGALALGDLGSFYPDNDNKYLNIDSSYFVNDVYSKMDNLGFMVSNIDISISLEKPKLKDYLIKMRQNISQLLNVNFDCVSIKAMSNEKLDAVGKSEAVEAYCIVLLKQKNNKDFN